MDRGAVATLLRGLGGGCDPGSGDRSFHRGAEDAIQEAVDASHEDGIVPMVNGRVYLTKGAGMTM